MTKTSEPSKQHVIDAAHSLFMEKGYIETSLDDIAVRAGVTKPTISLYFEDKSDLFRTVIFKIIESSSTKHTPPTEITSQAALTDELLKIAQNLNKIIADPDYIQLLRIAIAEANTHPDLRTLFDERISRRSIRYTTSIFKLANKHMSHPFINPKLSAEMFIGGFITRMLLSGLLQPSTERVKKLRKEELIEYVESFFAHF